MASNKYESRFEGKQLNKKSVNVVDLINKSKYQEKQQRKQNVVIGAVAVSVLAVAGYVITH